MLLNPSREAIAASCMVTAWDRPANPSSIHGEIKMGQGRVVIGFGGGWDQESGQVKWPAWTAQVATKVQLNAFTLWQLNPGKGTRVPLPRGVVQNGPSPHLLQDAVQAILSQLQLWQGRAYRIGLLFFKRKISL